MDVIQFFKDYGTYLCAGLVVLFDILLLIVKRRPKSLDDFVDVLQQTLLVLPDFIKRVEVPGNGLVKKDAVIKAAINFAESLLKRDLTFIESETLKSNCSSYIEEVLSTPTKKGE